jgi:anti-anti-sigma factor
MLDVRGPMGSPHCPAAGNPPRSLPATPGTGWRTVIGLAGVGEPPIEILRNEGGVLAIRGEVDPASAPEFRARLQVAARDGSGDLVLDLTDLRFIDSSGLKVLLEIAGYLGEGRTVVLRNPQRGVLRLFDVAGIERLGDFRVER